MVAFLVPSLSYSGRGRRCGTAHAVFGEGEMPDRDGPAERATPEGAQVAEEIVRRAPQDLVFVMRFLGESQYRMLRHFQEFIRAEAGRRGATAEAYPVRPLRRRARGRAARFRLQRRGTLAPF